MSHNLRSNRSNFKRGNKKNRRKPRSICKSNTAYESLETRRMLAFSFGFDGATLTLTQTTDDGGIIVDNNGTGDAFRTTDGSGTVEYSAATNLVVNLLDGTGNQLDFNLDNAHTGDVELNLGDGNRLVNFDGTSNSIGGSLAVNSGTENQGIELAKSANFSVSGSASFNLGLDFDTVDEDAFDIDAGDWNMVGVNRFENNGTMTVSNVMFDVSADNSSGEFDNDSVMNISGDFTYLGGDQFDTLNTNATFNLTGNYDADVGDGGSNFNINNPNVSIGGTVSLAAAGDGSIDDLNTVTGAEFGGNWTVDLGAGTNNLDFFGTFNGDEISYTGGSGVDTVNYDFSGNPAEVVIDLGQGDDDFTLGPNASISPTTLSVDFGLNNDSFTNNFGAFTFDALLSGLLGFDYQYDSTSDTLSATEIANSGAVEFDNNGLANAWRFNNGAAEITPSDNLSIVMLDDTGATLDIDLDFAMVGNLDVDLGNGARTLNFSGFDNSVNGNVTIVGGDDDQRVELAVNANFSAGADLTVDLGLGSDIVDEDGNDISVAGSVHFDFVNLFENDGTMTVDGDFEMDTTGETENSEWDNDGTTVINGNFTYNGGSEVDDIFANDGTTIVGNLVANLGDGISTSGDDQDVSLESGSEIGGTVSVTAGDSTNGDVFASDGATIFGDNITVKLGEGQNSASFLGTFGGTDVLYVGGNGSDNVSFGLTGGPANVNAILGGGDDTFVLNAGADIGPLLRVDFGGGVDTFINNFGALSFNTNLLNLDGFNRFFNVGLNQWQLNQLVNAGDVTISNNGTGNAIQLTNSFLTTMAPADTVRLSMFSNTSGVEVDLGSPLAGDLILNLFDGDRTVNFIGSDNSIGGNLFVEANDGVQNVELAVNNSLSVGLSAVMNLRGGMDVVTEAGNNISVGESLIFRGVNEFENLGTLTAGAMLMNTSFEVAEARLDNDGTMNILDSLIYIGGESKDDIILNDGVTVGGNVSLDVGPNLASMPAQNINLNGFHGMASVTIIGGDSFGGNSLVTDAFTVMNDNFIVDFTANTSTNQAVFLGTYTGNLGFYQGGIGQDTVNMEEVAGDMDFFVKLGDDDDTLNLGNGTSLVYLFVNFGSGNDTFNDEFAGVYPFATNFWNL